MFLLAQVAGDELDDVAADIINKMFNIDRCQ